MSTLLSSGLGILGFSIPLVTELFILIDYGIYSIAYFALVGFFQVLKVSYSIFSVGAESFEQIYSIITRAMTLAGIYALFMISLSLINQLINPSTKDTFGPKIIIRVVTAVVLLMTSRFIFSKLGEFQQLIFESRIIPTIVYGKDDSELENTDEDGENIEAKKYVNSVWLQFFTPKEGVTSMSDCVTTYTNVGNGKGEIISLIGCHYKYYDYFPIAPFIVGLMLCYYFITYSIELCIRLVKMIVLQVIYPIPVIMSIDPKTGEKRLTDYFGLYFKIYLQVFLRVMTLYLAFALLNLIMTFIKNSSDIIDGGWFLTIVLIIGVFKGMKELPKLVEDALGMKFDGGRAKSFGGALKGIVAGGAGLVGGAVMGGITGGVGGAIAGGLSGASNAWKDASANNGKSIKDSVMSASTKGGSWGTKFNSAGGIMNYAGGAVRNMFGGQARDNKTLEGFDKKSDGIRKNISEMQGNMNDINRSSQLRDNLERVMENRFIEQNGSLNEAYANNMAVQRGQALIDAEIAKGDNANWKMIESYTESLNQLKENVKAEYEAKQQKYYDEQLDLASKGGGANLDADIERAYNQSKSYDQSAGLSDRSVSSMADLQKLREGDMTKIADLENQIRAKNAEIDEVNRQKKEFEGSTKFKAGKAAASSK